MQNGYLYTPRQYADTRPRHLKEKLLLLFKEV